MSYKIQKNSFAKIDEDNWINRFGESLQKEAVQSVDKDKSIFDQITSIMSGKSKYQSVQAAVDDMMNRSGLTTYLKNKKLNIKKAQPNQKVDSTPIVIKKCPRIADTIKNYIESTRGNLSLPAILNKVRTIHKNDVSESSDWDDDNLLRWISKENLLAKTKNAPVDTDYASLGKNDNLGDDTDIDPSNTDAFNVLNTATT